MSTYAWLDHYPKGVDWHEPIPVGALHERLDRAAKLYPHHTCVVFKGKEFTYATIVDKVNRFARGLHEMGIGKGSRVGIFLPNTPHYIIAYYGILRAGATVVNFNPLYSHHELEHQIHDAGVTMMVTLDLKMLYDKLNPFITQGALKTVIVGEMSEVLPLTKAALFSLAKAKDIADIPFNDAHVRFATMLNYPPEVQTAQIDPYNDIAVLQYTGGTTGVPKGVVLTHANLTANIRQCRLWFTKAHDGNETIMGILPFFHVFAMTVVLNFAIASGFRIIMHPRFEIKSVLDDIERYRPSLMPGVPTMFAAILAYSKVSKFDLSSLKMCISGGAPLPMETKRRFEEMTGATLFEGYGLSESSPVVACNPPFGVNKSGSIGLPLPGTILEIIDKDDETTPLPQGEIGEICIRGQQVMQGYFKQPEETQKVLKDGKLHTGDLGYMDEEGYFFIVDRKKEMILSGGYNIYPRNIEEALYQHEAIAEAAVIGVPHPIRGQVPKAFVVLREGKHTDAAQLKAHLKEHITAYAMPHEFVFLPELPKSPIGKILKKMLS